MPDKHRFFGGLEPFGSGACQRGANWGGRKWGLIHQLFLKHDGTQNSNKKAVPSFFLNSLPTLTPCQKGRTWERSWFPLMKYAKKACPSFRPYLEALSISGNSQSIVVIEGAFSFKISSSIDS